MHNSTVHQRSGIHHPASSTDYRCARSFSLKSSLSDLRCWLSQRLFIQASVEKLSSGDICNIVKLMVFPSSLPTLFCFENPADEGTLGPMWQWLSQGAMIFLLFTNLTSLYNSEFINPTLQTFQLSPYLKPNKGKLCWFALVQKPNNYQLTVMMHHSTYIQRKCLFHKWVSLEYVQDIQQCNA